ncbi:hypothetical protein RCL1_005681 [Eukaryota sp. TZLM3-RCL]
MLLANQWVVYGSYSALDRFRVFQTITNIDHFNHFLCTSPQSVHRLCVLKKHVLPTPLCRCLLFGGKLSIVISLLPGSPVESANLSSIWKSLCTHIIGDFSSHSSLIAGVCLISLQMEFVQVSVIEVWLFDTRSSDIVEQVRVGLEKWLFPIPFPTIHFSHFHLDSCAWKHYRGIIFPTSKPPLRRSSSITRSVKSLSFSSSVSEPFTPVVASKPKKKSRKKKKKKKEKVVDSFDTNHLEQKSLKLIVNVNQKVKLAQESMTFSDFSRFFRLILPVLLIFIVSFAAIIFV